MKERSKKTIDRDRLRRKLIGLGEKSLRKSYYPQLKAASDELSDRESFLKTLFENTTDSIIYIDSDWVIRDCNPAFLNTFGYYKGEVLNRSFNLLHSTAASSEEFGKLVRAAVEGTGRWRGEWIFRTRDQRRLSFELAMLARPGNDEHFQGYISILRDISERKAAEQALKESENRYRLTLDAVPDAITVTRLRDGQYRFVNDGFCRLTGCSREEVMGNTASRLDLYDDLENREKMLRTVVENGQLLNAEVKLRRMDGSLWDAVVSCRMMEIDGEPHLIALARDVTELKRMEAEKAKLESRLRQAQKMEAMGALAGGIAHDFNNILAVIIGYTELAQDKAASGLPSPMELDRIMNSAERAKDLVTQILTFSRKLEPELGLVNLNQVIEQTEKMLERTIPKMVEIKLDMATDIWLINADLGQMSQILMNLATNANDAMPDGGELVIATENVVLDRESDDPAAGLASGDYVKLIVADNGHGMNQETIEQIFDPFFTRKDIGKGTGLGLATVYGIVKSHDGAIVCDSQVGGGTTFRVYLPAVRSGRPDEDTTAEIDPDALAGVENILYVDDEKAISSLGKEILTRRGYRVSVAHSGEEALELHRKRGADIDLTILDISMPGMGGGKCLRELLKQNPRAKVIISSGYLGGNEMKQSLASGAAGFLDKPFTKAELLTRVREVLDK